MVGNPVSLWWENITGPLTLTEEIGACLADGKGVVLHLDGNISWMDAMREYTICKFCPDAQLHIVPWSNMSEKNSIVPKLLESVCPQNADICPSEYKAQLSYIRNEKIFRNKVVWIILDSCEDLQLLAGFVAEHRYKNVEQCGTFVVEIMSKGSLPHIPENLSVFCSGDYIREGSIRLFSSMIADANAEISPQLKEYSACVSANLAGQNAELAQYLLENIHFQTEDPAEAMTQMAEQGRISVDLRQDIKKVVWKAQLQTVFSKIEMARLQIISEKKDEIEEALRTEYYDSKRDRTGYVTHQNGIEIETTEDVELGTLRYMMSLRRNKDREQYLLYFPDESFRKWIIFLSNCRNNLAHYRCCGAEEMFQLLTALRDQDIRLG